MSRLIPIGKELQHAFDMNELLKENSKMIYRSVYRRFIRMSDATKITDMSEANIIKVVNQEDIPPKSQESLLDVAILVRKAHDASYEKLLRFKTVQLKKTMDSRKLEKNEKLKGELPDKSQLDLYLKTLYNDKNYVAYIVNFLLLNYGVRNMDLNLIMTSDKGVILKSNKSKSNYLYITTAYVVYLRNNYKTYSTYGSKRIRIVKKSFLNACKQLLGDNYDVPLLKLKNGDEISEGSVGRVVQSMTYDGLGEGRYFKSLIVDAKKTKNIKRIRELADHRGTDVEEVFNSYDIDNQN